MIKPWLFEFFRSPSEKGFLTQKPKINPSLSDIEIQFKSYWDLWLKAEEYGFEGIFFSEHHFGTAYSPSPNLLISALAPVTKTLKLGVMGVVLPYYNAWRVIEEIGMLDHLTNGRLEVGTASGIPPEMAQVGLGVAEANERNAEAQDILDWVLAHPGEPVTHHGKYWNFDKLMLVPPLRQRPPNRWTTVVSETSARRSARRGTRICTGFSSVEQVQKIFDAYREEAKQVGLPVAPDSFGLRRVVMLDEDGDKARALAQECERQVLSVFLNLDDRVNHGPVPDAPQKSHGGFQISSQEYIGGTPEEVAEQIIGQCDAVGAGHFMAMLDNHGGLEENRKACELFAQRVIPLLRSAGGSVSSSGRHETTPA